MFQSYYVINETVVKASILKTPVYTNIIRIRCFMSVLYKQLVLGGAEPADTFQIGIVHYNTEARKMRIIFFLIQPSMLFILHKFQGIFQSYFGNMDSILKNSFLQTLLDVVVHALAFINSCNFVNNGFVYFLSSHDTPQEHTLSLKSPRRNKSGTTQFR